MDRSLELFAARSSLRWAAEQGFVRQMLRAQLARGWRRPAPQAPLPATNLWRAGGLQTVSVEAMRPHPRRAASFDERLRPLQSSLRHR